MPVRVLVHDRGSTFPAAFEAVFRSVGLKIVPIPPCCPQANGVAERWIRSARQEYLDHLLALGKAHLRRILFEYAPYFDRGRSHQGLRQRIPDPPEEHRRETGSVRGTPVLGGMHHTYHRAA